MFFIWSGEVREAVLSLLARKEELQVETRSFKRLLVQAQEETRELKAELAETNRQHGDKIERLESRIQALFRWALQEKLCHSLSQAVRVLQS
jgi:hypothetical protein